MMSENGHIRIFGFDLSATGPLTLFTPERGLGWGRCESAVGTRCWACAQGGRD